jgi:phosphatidate cytidylyltransferase
VPGQARLTLQAKAGAWSDLRLRVLSAVVLLPVGLGGLWLGGWAWAVLVAAGAVGMALEFATISGASGMAAAMLVAIAAGCAAAGFAGFGLLVLLGGTIATLRGWRWGWMTFGLPYVGLPALALVWLRDMPGSGRENVLFLLLVVWATDIFAYVAGRLFGGPKLAPGISPGKTWSGAVGGLAGAGVAGVVLAGLAGLPLAMALSVVAQAGDLMESGLKRRFGVKDSGRLIPGHGGLLDRLDGVLTAAPLAALLALAAGRGRGLWQ